MEEDAVLELPWPMLSVSEDGQQLEGTTALVRLLGVCTLTLEALDERFEVLREDGDAYPRYELPWNRAARREEFEERQVWIDRQVQMRLPLIVNCRADGDRTLLSLSEAHTAQLLPCVGEFLATLPNDIRCDARSTAGDRLCDVAIRTTASQGALLFGASGHDFQMPVLGARGFNDDALAPFTVQDQRSLTTIAAVVRTRQLRELELPRRIPGAVDPLDGLLAFGFRAATVVPVMALGDVMGVLAVVRRQPAPLTVHEWRALDALASLGGFALRESGAREHRRRAFVRLRTLHSAGVTLQANLPLTALLERLVELARRLTGADRGWLRLQCPDGTWQWVPDEKPPDPLPGALVVPLRLGDENFGEFVLSPGDQPFSDEDHKLMTLFTAHTAVAVAYARQADAADRESQRLSALLEGVPEGLVFMRTGKPDLILNRAARTMLGPIAEGRGVDDLRERVLAPDGSWPEAGHPLDRVLRGELVFDQRAVIARGEDRTPAVVTAAPLLGRGGAQTGAVVVLIDVTLQQRQQRQREEATAIIAHDLRNPVNALLGQVSLVQRRVDSSSNPDLVRGLDRIRRLGARLDRMVDDLVDAARIETQQLRVECRTVSLPRLVEELVSDLQPSLGEHPIALEVRARADVRIVADPLRVQQMLTNLLENAARYSGGNRPIEVIVEEDEEGGLVTVRDHGPGIHPDHVNKIFDRFFQAPSTLRRPGQGLGLGLYITRKLAEAQRGRITVDSTPGRGSAFTLWLPKGDRRVTDASEEAPTTH